MHSIQSGKSSGGDSLRQRAVRRRARGYCIAETVAAIVVLTPIMLAGLDMCMMAITANINSHLAKDAARAAANQESREKARLAAEGVVRKLPLSTLIVRAELKRLEFREATQEVAVETAIDVKLPAPFPTLERARLVALATEAIISRAADL